MNPLLEPEKWTRAVNNGDSRFQKMFFGDAADQQLTKNQKDAELLRKITENAEWDNYRNYATNDTANLNRLPGVYDAGSWVGDDQSGQEMLYPAWRQEDANISNPLFQAIARIGGFPGLITGDVASGNSAVEEAAVVETIETPEEKFNRLQKEIR